MMLSNDTLLCDIVTRKHKDSREEAKLLTCLSMTLMHADRWREQRSSVYHWKSPGSLILYCSSITQGWSSSLQRRVCLQAMDLATGQQPVRVGQS